MADCICLPSCIFFNDKMENMHAMAQMYKTKYCLEDSSKCARHMVFDKKGKDFVPKDLFPNQIERAKEIIK